ncbi:MAG: hypothetical protein ACLTHV_06210 [Parasutterella excrementihominis]
MIMGRPRQWREFSSGVVSEYSIIEVAEGVSLLVGAPKYWYGMSVIGELMKTGSGS